MNHQPIGSLHVRAERPTRILDAAVTLLLRWGYGRVTMDDIGLEAGVGTGTLYLHWKTKESLFESVLLRELHTLLDELAQQLRNAPSDVLLHRCLPMLLRAIKERPLAHALFIRDVALLGKLTQGPLIQQSQQLFGADTFLTTLRQLGLLRADVDSAVQAHAFSAIWTGFVLVDTVVRPADQAHLVMQLEALAETIRRTFEPDRLPEAVRLREEVAPRIIAWFEQARDQLAEQIVARTIE
ncbi:MAG: helix-turn-helix domain-containing protein [Roseiflexaceae bacterium]